MKLQRLTKITQGNDKSYSFWQTSINARDIIDNFEINRIMENPEEGIQRHLNNSRAQEIAEFCKRDDAIFPTAIIVSLNSDLIDEKIEIKDLENDELDELIINTSFNDRNEDKNSAEYKESIKPFSIIDGQHRLSGLDLYYQKNPDGKNFHLPLNIYIDADQAKSAQIFVTINHNQRSVDSSTINNLFGIIYNGNNDVWTVESFASRVVEILDNNEYSPFHKGIKKYGKKTSEHQFISQGTVAKKIQINCSANPNRDNLALEKGYPLKHDDNKIFRKYFISNDASRVASIIIEYFSAFKFAFEDCWESPELLIKKAVGFSALMKFLVGTMQFYREEEFGSIFNFYTNLFNKFDPTFIEEEFNKSNGSSESVANKIARNMLDKLFT